MADRTNIISISSDSEDDEGPRKKIRKITPVTLTDPLEVKSNIKNLLNKNNVKDKEREFNEIEVVVLDDDDNSRDTIIAETVGAPEEIIVNSTANWQNGNTKNSTIKSSENSSKVPSALPLEKDDNSQDFSLLIPVHEEPYVEDSPKKSPVSGEESGKENEIEDGEIVESDNEIHNNESEGNDERIPISENIKEKSDQPTEKKISEPPPFVLPEIVKSFMDLVQNKIKNTSFSILSDKFPLMVKACRKCSSSYLESTNFKRILEEHTKKAQTSPSEAAFSFGFIYDHLKEVNKSQSLEVDETVWRNLKKLEKCIQLLTKKIKELEEAEVDFDDENDEDTSYIQLDRYQKRLTQVYAKYCKILKKNPYSGRLTYENLGFVDSEYLEINRAINNKYKNNRKFPSYHEMEKFIRKCVKEHNLALNEGQIRRESENCFRKIGELLQARRKKELYESHYMFIKEGEDPAIKDSALNEKLKKDFVEGNKKLEKVVQEYVIKQEIGNPSEEPTEEHDSDNSNYVDSEASSSEVETV